MLRIFHPPGYLSERQYIYDVLIREFLGFDYSIEVYDGKDVRITLQGDPLGKVLIISDILFQTPEEQWLTSASLPKQPLNWWDVSDLPGNTLFSRLPIIYGRVAVGPSLYNETEEGIVLGLDVFGGAFFMLTRYEELVKHDRDQLGRFPAKASLALQEGFLERPIVNEYLDILWRTLERLWPQLQRQSRVYRVLLSHDVDRPLCTVGRGLLQILKSGMADIVMRHDVSLALHRLRSYVQTRQGPCDCDPCNTFDFIMNLSEQHGRQSAFYFITDNTAGAVDADYSLDDPWIRGLIRRIHERGHELGLHPSYNTYRDPAQTKRELEKLLQVSAEEGICQKDWGGRQHYLRWESPTTWQNWEDAGLGYDSTLSFADHVGFRCGICYEYPVFNLRTRQRLKLHERPLIVMEVTLLGYMSFSWEASMKKILELSAICKNFEGDFTLLWHNNNLMSKKQKQWYSMVSEAL